MAYCQLLFPSCSPAEIARDCKLCDAPRAFLVQSWHRSDQTKRCMRGCAEVSWGCGLFCLTQYVTMATLSFRRSRCLSESKGYCWVDDMHLLITGCLGDRSNNTEWKLQPWEWWKYAKHILNESVSAMRRYARKKFQKYRTFLKYALSRGKVACSVVCLFRAHKQGTNSIVNHGEDFSDCCTRKMAIVSRETERTMTSSKG